MQRQYEIMFPFTTDNDCYIYNGNNGKIYHSNKDLNEMLHNVQEGNIDASPDLARYVSSLIGEDPIEETKIRNFTQVSQEQWMKGNVVHKIWLSLTESCNMNCSYCFGEYGNKGFASMMSIETAKKCIDYFFRYANQYVDVYSVRFFGGEPLLNKEVLQFSIEYINEKTKDVGKRISYLLTTNGTLIDDQIMQLVMDNNISLNISIDGDRNIHNHNRIYKNGMGTFDSVMEGINRINKSGYKNLIARVTLSKPGIATFKNDIEFLWRIGFSQVYVDLVETNKKDLIVDCKDLEELDIQLKQLLDAMVKHYKIHDYKALRNITDTYEFIDKQLLKEACMYFNPFTIQFTPNGDVYKCCRVLNKDIRFAGNVDKGIDWQNYYRKFTHDNKCNNCWAKRLCGGGCKAVDNMDLHCEFWKLIYHYSLKYYMYMKELVESK